MTTRVVHVNSQEWKDTPEDQRVYIGRAVPRRGFKASKWANPFKISATCTRAQAVTRYSLHIMNDMALMDALHELKDKTLGCWCAPDECHGDVLAALAEIEEDRVKP